VRNNNLEFFVLFKNNFQSLSAGEYARSCMGTEYNGFLLFDSDSSDSFLEWWSNFKDKVMWYVEQTHTITARRR
jgi:hypothetical protein